MVREFRHLIDRIAKDAPAMGGIGTFARAAGMIAVIILAGGCAVIPKKEQAFAFPNHVEEAAREAVGEPVEAAPPPATGEEKPVDRLVYYQGVQGSLTTREEGDALAGKTISLNFVNAPAADVARAVVGDVLGLAVSVADGVSGVVTLSAPDPLPAADALAALEAVLAESGLALLRVKDGFLLTKLDEAVQGSAPINRGAAVGYGVAFAPVRHATPAEIAGLVQPFISDRLTITPDEARGAIILKGPQSDIAVAMDAIATFDSPQLVDRIFGMFRLEYADADTLRSEINSIIDASNAGGGAPIDILALPRLNLLFVTAKTKQAFDETRGWIERLDRPSGGDERRLRYYSVLNTSAEALAEQLNSAFGGGSSFEFAAPAAPSTSPDSAVQPTFRAPSPRRSVSAAGADQLSIAVDQINNALIIRATDQEYREVADLIERMDVLTPQVLIEATIAEVTLNDAIGYGVRWFFENAESRVSFPGFNPGGRDDNNPATSLNPFPSVVPGLNYSFAANNVSAALDLLDSVTEVSVLSAPSIMVLNNQAAHLQVGDEVPIVTQQAQSTVDPDAPLVSTLQLRETGVILDVKPRINASDVVVLEITQEVSDVTPTTTSGIDSPTIQQRKFTSTVAVKNDGTIALGGLIRETFSDNETGVPVLKDIPGLGHAFKSRDVTKRRTELVIFLTPRIIRTDDDARNAIKYIRREMTRLGKPAS
jgi:general secretion pathway protein D